MNRVDEVLEVLSVTSDLGFVWFGKRNEVLERDRAYADRPAMMRASLVRRLTDHLYANFYTVGVPAPTMARLQAPDRHSMSDALGDANRGRGGFDAGWTFQRHERPHVVVERSGLQLWARPHEVRISSGREFREGDQVEVWRPEGAPNASPGFYTALGNAGFQAPWPPLLDRFYFHVGPSTAVDFLRVATAQLNAAGLPFHLKVVDDPSGYDRCDTAVLSLQRVDRMRAVAAVERLYGTCRNSLLAGTPALTLQLGPGLAFAEDPGDGESFGMHRCRILADACVRASSAARTSLEHRRAVVEECFVESGVDPHEPWRGIDSPADVLEIHHKGAFACL